MRRTPEENTLALECLRLAAGSVTRGPAEEMVAAAGKFLAFVLADGRDDAEIHVDRTREALKSS